MAIGLGFLPTQDLFGSDFQSCSRFPPRCAVTVRVAPSRDVLPCFRPSETRESFFPRRHRAWAPPLPSDPPGLTFTASIATLSCGGTLARSNMFARFSLLQFIRLPRNHLACPTASAFFPIVPHLFPLPDTAAVHTFVDASEYLCASRFLLFTVPAILPDTKSHLLKCHPHSASPLFMILLLRSFLSGQVLVVLRSCAKPEYPLSGKMSV